MNTAPLSKQALQRSALINLLRWPDAVKNDGDAVMPAISPARLDTLAETPLNSGAVSSEAAIRYIEWDKSTNFLANSLSSGLFQDAVRVPILNDLAKPTWYQCERHTPFAHLFHSLNAFVSRTVPMFADLNPPEITSPEPSPNDMAAQRSLMLTILGRSLYYGHRVGRNAQDALVVMQRHIAWLETLCDSLDKAPPVVGQTTPLPRPNAVTFQTRERLFAVAIERAFQRLGPDEAVLANNICSWDSQLGLMAVMYARYMRRLALDPALSVATTSLYDIERLAARETVAKLAPFYAFARTPAASGLRAQRVVATMLMLRVDLPWLMFGPLHSEPIALHQQARPTLSDLFVGVQQLEPLRNWSVQLAVYPPAVFAESGLQYAQLMSGQAALAPFDELFPVNNSSVVDSLFYQITKPTIMALANRALAHHYGDAVELGFNFVCGSRVDRLLWIGQDSPSTSLTVGQAYNAQVMLERSVRAMVAAHWHRYFSLFPNTSYLRGVLAQLSRIDKALGEVFTDQELRKVFPPLLYDRFALEHLVTQLVSAAGTPVVGSGKPQSPAAAAAAATAAPLSADQAKQALNMYSAFTQIQLEAAPAPAVAKPPAALPSSPTPPLTPISPTPAILPSTNDIRFVLGRPGALDNRLVVGAGDHTAFMKAVLEPLYNERPYLTPEGMAFALRWTIGIGLWKRETSQVEINPLTGAWDRMPDVVTGTQVLAGDQIDYRTYEAEAPYTGGGELATPLDVNTAKARGLQLRPIYVALTRRWYLVSQDAATGQTAFVLEDIDAPKIRAGDASSGDPFAVDQLVNVGESGDGVFAHGAARTSRLDSSGAFSMLVLCSFLMEMPDSARNAWCRGEQVPFSAEPYDKMPPSLVGGRSTKQAAVVYNDLVMAHVRNMVVASALRLGSLGANLREVYETVVPETMATLASFMRGGGSKR